jgi:uncharacterized integral membrane protein
MKNIANLLTSIIIATWVIGIAIFSVQNFTSVSLRFLGFQSIQIPVGIMLAFCAALGMIAVAILQPLWGISATRASNSRVEDDAEFFVDEDY